MEELNKLERYLKAHNIPYRRHDDDCGLYGRHQIYVYSHEGQRLWDAIWQAGSYGYSQGLLEIMGSIVDEEADGDSVVGYLTADDIVKRMNN